ELSEAFCRITISAFCIPPDAEWAGHAAPRCAGSAILSLARIQPDSAQGVFFRQCNDSVPRQWYTLMRRRLIELTEKRPTDEKTKTSTSVYQADDALFSSRGDRVPDLPNPLSASRHGIRANRHYLTWPAAADPS